MSFYFYSFFLSVLELLLISHKSIRLFYAFQRLHYCLPHHLRRVRPTPMPTTGNDAGGGSVWASAVAGQRRWPEWLSDVDPSGEWSTSGFALLLVWADSVRIQQFPQYFSTQVTSGDATFLMFPCSDLQMGRSKLNVKGIGQNNFSDVLKLLISTFKLNDWTTRTRVLPHLFGSANSMQWFEHCAQDTSSVSPDLQHHSGYFFKAKASYQKKSQERDFLLLFMRAKFLRSAFKATFPKA